MASAVAPVERAQTRLRLLSSTPRAYSNPYLTGILLGLVLLSAYVLMGRGLGASGAFATGATAAANAIAPKSTQINHYFVRYLGADGTVQLDWLVLELLGVSVGGLLSALLAGRVRFVVERGPRITQRSRLFLAFGGGSIMGLGAVLARGCTSGQALTGGALLSVGSWLFIGGAFAAAYAVAPLFRKAWT